MRNNTQKHVHRDKIYIYENMNMHTYIHTHIHPSIHPSIHPYIHTYIHTYIHILNEFETPIKIGDFKCKTSHKLRQKQFNIPNDEYWKLLIYNNPSFAATNFAEVCLDIAFDFKFRDLLILMAIISQKQNLATVNSLKLVETILSKILKLYRFPAPLPTSGWLVRQNTFFVSLTL